MFLRTATSYCIAMHIIMTLMYTVVTSLSSYVFTWQLAQVGIRNSPQAVCIYLLLKIWYTYTKHYLNVLV